MRNQPKKKKRKPLPISTPLHFGPVRFELAEILEKNPLSLGTTKAIQGLILVRLTNLDDTHLRCAQYVLGSRKQEEGFLDFSEDAYDNFWGNPGPLKTLTSLGYQVAKSPLPGDVIGYASIATHPPGYNLQFRFKHFGLYEGDDIAISKFGKGHIFRHNWQTVPVGYGSHAVFFRKT